MPAVLGVHGIGQQFRGGPELTQVWWLALRAGLEAAELRAAADAFAVEDLRVVFFGNLFRPAGAMGAEPPYGPSDVAPGPERDLLMAMYEEALRADPDLGPPVGAMGGGHAAVTVILDRLLRNRTFARVASRALIGNLKQVTSFLTDPRIKALVLERMAAEFTDDVRVVIGHSLGSVVAYEFLAQSPGHEVPLFVSAGSPLGIPNLIFERLTPTPAAGAGAWPGVAGWMNVADRNDIVAMRRHLAPLFPQPDKARGIRDEPVNNGDEPHAITRYLNAQVTGAAIGAVL